jgi:hypothetical protein
MLNRRAFLYAGLSAALAAPGSTSAATPQSTPQARMPNLPLIPFLASCRNLAASESSMNAAWLDAVRRP